MSGQTPEQLHLPASLMRVIVTGFMGAGKTTVGGLLAERLGWDFADSDHHVEARTGKTIAAIFEAEGESAFRDLEAMAIQDLVTGAGRVVGLGGGALERPETRALLASLPHTLIVFLDAPLDVLIARCSGQPGGPIRPVLGDSARLQERWTARLPWYRLAHLTIDTTGLSPDAVVDVILRQIGDRWGGSVAKGADAASVSVAGRTGVPA